MKSYITLLISIACLSLSAQTEITTFHPGITTDGISYFLPQTRLHLTVQAERTVVTPGEYAPYAAHYLRLGDVPQERREEWRITSVTLEPYGIADPTRAYTIRFKQKTLAPLVTLTQDGVLLAINTETALPAPLSQPAATAPVSDAVKADDYKTPEILAANSQRKAAELAAAEIYDIRENRGLLTKGQADFMPTDGEQLKLMLADLATTEAALLQLFRGTTATSQHTFTMDFTPANFSGKKSILFRFSDKYGFCAADDLSGEPYYLTVTDEHTLPAEEPNPKGKKEIEGLRYCVPSQARITLTNADGQNLYSASVPFAQIGRVESLGGELFNKKTSTHLLLHPTTGGILRIEAEPAK